MRGFSQCASVLGDFAKKLLSVIGLSVSVFAAAPTLAATPENFNVRSAADLVAICTTVPSDNNSSATVGFCHSYVVGVYRTLEVAASLSPRGAFTDNGRRAQALPAQNTEIEVARSALNRISGFGPPSRRPETAPDAHKFYNS